MGTWNGNTTPNQGSKGGEAMQSPYQDLIHCVIAVVKPYEQWRGEMFDGWQIFLEMNLYWVLGRSEWQLVLGAVKLESPHQGPPASQWGFLSPLPTMLPCCQCHWTPMQRWKIARILGSILNLEAWVPPRLRGSQVFNMGLPPSLVKFFLLSWNHKLPGQMLTYSRTILKSRILIEKLESRHRGLVLQFNGGSSLSSQVTMLSMSWDPCEGIQRLQCSFRITLEWWS